MSSISKLASAGAIISGGALGRFIPEPKNKAGSGFGGVLKSLSGLASGALGAAGIPTEYNDLISKQIEIQNQMQMVSLQSNLEKSKHETEMAAIRNIRVG